jgi:hypothetical protein
MSLIHAGVAAHQHPLGFYVIDFTELIPPENRQGQLRLHAWPEDFRSRSDGRGEIHTHRWHLRSGVLRGSVRNTTYEVIPQPGSSGAIFDVVYGPKGTSLMTSARGAIAHVLKVAEVNAGEYYTQEAEQFHSSDLPRAPAVTIVLAIPAGLTAQVYAPLGSERGEKEEFVRSEVDSGTILELLAPDDDV